MVVCWYPKTKAEKKTLKQIHPILFVLRAFYELFCLLFCLVIAIWYISTNAPFKYFILYSYWNNTIAGFMFLVSFIFTISTINASYRNAKLFGDPIFIKKMNVIKVFRDFLIQFIIIQLLISTIAFWWFQTYTSSPFSSIPSFLSHTILFLFVILQLCFTVNHETSWVIVLVLIHNVCYYVFTVPIYYNAGYWIYAPQGDTAQWILICICVILCSIVSYWLIVVFNHFKNNFIIFVTNWMDNESLHSIKHITGKSGCELFIIGGVIRLCINCLLNIFGCFVIGFCLYVFLLIHSNFQIQLILEFVILASVVLTLYLGWSYFAHDGKDVDLFVIVNLISDILIFARFCIAISGIITYYNQNQIYLYLSSVLIIILGGYTKISLYIHLFK